MTDQTTETVDQMAEDTNQVENQEQNPANNMIPKHRFDEVNQQKKEAQEALKNVVDGMKQEIPEQYQSLVPNVKPEDQIKWIQDAKKAGMFNSQPASSPEPARPGPTNSSKDISSMTPDEKFEAAYNQMQKNN